jgi:exonuclease SbcC
VLIQRLHLRNFRVFEDPLELDLPSGLVGIYGPNGAGKSTLLESILWALWGKSRTAKDQVRTSGTGGDCVVEVDFEHEGHEYAVRRIMSGAVFSIKMEVECDASLVASGVREAERYVESLLGMDDAAFRASVFAEQKQLSAFSDRRPEERRKIVLQLLGITPLDVARDAARRDARDKAAAYEEVRKTLPDISSLALLAEDAQAAADAAEVHAEEETRAADAVTRRREAAQAELLAAERVREDHEALLIEGTAARRELDSAEEALRACREELQALETAARELADLQGEAAGLEDDERQLEPLSEAASAARAFEASEREAEPEPPAPDETALEKARADEASARDLLASTKAAASAALAELARARDTLERAEGLTGEESCPLCGQELGGAFERVRAHRAAELEEAQRRVRSLDGELLAAKQAAKAAGERLAQVASATDQARPARQRWEAGQRRQAEAREAFERSWRALSELSPRRAEGSPPEAEALTKELAALRETVARKRAAREEARRLEGRLERREALERSLASWTAKVDAARQRVDDLREKVRALGHQPQRLESLREAVRDTIAAEEAARKAREKAVVAAASRRTEATAAQQRVDEARRQHTTVAELEADARHLERAATLLAEFRNTVVASVGPQLAADAAALFGELTDHEYEDLAVDADTYQIQIRDGGVLYDLDRFSGSESDLANLALRVAISEHVRFLSGGAVGLLVLDEVFGPLDDSRKVQMLQALERLKARFRQVLVVTHDSAIKDQLPGAIEVVKLAGRRASARLLA